MRPVFVSLILAVVTPGLASSAYGQDGPDIVVKGKPQKADKKICKIFDAPTGSRVGGGRICRPATEWKIDEERAQRNMQSENQRLQADRAMTENEKNALAVPRAH